MPSPDNLIHTDTGFVLPLRGTPVVRPGRVAMLVGVPAVVVPLALGFLAVVDLVLRSSGSATGDLAPGLGLPVFFLMVMGFGTYALRRRLVELAYGRPEVRVELEGRLLRLWMDDGVESGMPSDLQVGENTLTMKGRVVFVELPADTSRWLESTLLAVPSGGSRADVPSVMKQLRTENPREVSRPCRRGTDVS